MAFEGRRCVGGLLLSDQLERVPNMERKAVIEFLATLPPADLLNMVAEVARLRDCRAAELRPRPDPAGAPTAPASALPQTRGAGAQAAPRSGGLSGRQRAALHSRPLLPEGQ